jgi:SAM-dependent methyltransferase
VTRETQSTQYKDVLGVSAHERQRLLTQAKNLEPEARWLLDRIDVRPGWRATDIGCGPIGVLDVLSERVGPDGEVIGLDLEPRFVAMAKQIVAERGLTNVHVVQGDARSSDLPHDSFDVVHERLLLVGPMREPVVAEMFAITRPGGVAAAQEIDMFSAFCAPAHPAWDTLFDVFRTFVEGHGADLRGARHLATLLRDGGFANVEAEVHARLARVDEPRRLQLLALISSIREPLFRQGTWSSDHLDTLVASLRSHLEDPNTVVMPGLVVQAWGYKPVA